MRERRKEGGKGGESPESDKKMSEWSGERGREVMPPSPQGESWLGRKRVQTELQWTVGLALTHIQTTINEKISQHINIQTGLL